MLELCSVQAVLIPTLSNTYDKKLYVHKNNIQWNLDKSKTLIIRNKLISFEF